MKLAHKAFIITLLLLALAFSVSAQTLRSENDPRNTAPTVGTGGPPGGPTGLFTVYDGSTLRRGEFTFGIAYSNFDRDPGNADFVEVPVSFQVGLSDHLELWFNTDAYRAVKVNSPRHLSAFYLPNSRAIGNPARIIMGPFGPMATPFRGQNTYVPANTAPFVQFPYIGGSTGNFGLGFPSGPLFGFPPGSTPTIGFIAGGNGADNFPGLGSPFGSILPGIVLQTAFLLNPAGQPTTATRPTVFTLAPTYLPDAPFINRRYGESAFSTLTFGAKWRFTGPNNPYGIGIIPFYRWYVDNADEFEGFNQLQRGASPGGNRGDIGLFVFADARFRKWLNVSANVGYIYNSKIKSGDRVLLDRGDELQAAVAVDFPVNRYFQPILELRSTQYVGGRTPNALENNPVDGIAGARIYPTRWLSLGGAYRHHFNQQDRGIFKKNETFTGSAVVGCAPPRPNCVPVTFQNTFTGVPPGFDASSDPHGFIFSASVGRRNKRLAEVENKPPNITGMTVSDTEINLPCPPGQVSRSGGCDDSTTVNVSTTATDPENDVLLYTYTVSGGRTSGTGANIQWDLSGVSPGTYTVSVVVDDACTGCGKTETRTVKVNECPDCYVRCECPTLTVTGPAGVTNPGETMTFTANLSGGTQGSVTYNWTVSAGTIESGQGTPSITVSTNREMAGSNVTATVEIGGLDPACECPRTASETAGVAPVEGPVLVDEFGDLKPDDVRARLDAFFIDLQNNPNATGYIINYGTPRQIAARERLIRNHINFRRFDASRITIVNGGDTQGGVHTKLYRVPAGAENPTP